MTSAYLKVDSANVTIAPILGVALHGQARYDESSKVFKWALRQGADKLSGYYYLGLNDMMKEDWLTAYGWFRRASRLDSTDVNLVYYMGYCCTKAMYEYEADSLLNRAEQMLQPDSAMMFKINLTRAEMYTQDGQYSKGVKYYVKAESYGELMPAQIAKVGYAYRLAKNYRKALEYYNRYLTVGKEGSTTWKFVQAEMEFIREEEFMAGE
jgi:tetratricopeptide (TPR) repeat protein